MIHRTALAAIVLTTGAAAGGVALGHYATGNWQLQRGAVLQGLTAAAADTVSDVRPHQQEIALLSIEQPQAHVCQGCDAGRHLRRWGESLPDAYEDDYGPVSAPIAPDAYEAEADWGGGRPVRAASASYQVVEARDEGDVSRPMSGGATVMASATPPRLPVATQASSDAVGDIAAN